MARPQKQRHVAGDLPVSYFKPQGIPLVDLTEVVLSVDGYEALRLVDAGGLDQQTAAIRMGVSRSTLSRILAEARRATAQAISGGHALRIEGGNVTRPKGGTCRHLPRAAAGGIDTSD